MAKQQQKQERNLEKRNAPAQQALTFDAWWTRMCSRYDFSESLKEAVVHHMKARGFWDKGNWDAGIRDFGYLIK